MPIEENSAYDMSFNTLGRINYNLWKCNLAQEQDDPNNWFRALKNLYKEATIEMNDKQMEFHKKRMVEVGKDYKEFITYVNNFNNNVKLGMRQGFSPPRKIFDSCFQWELELREVLKNILMKKGERADQAMI